MNNSKAKKPRSINSCDTCRKRRLRCDKARPSCGRCVATGTTCTYLPETSISKEEPTQRETRSISQEGPSLPQDISTTADPNVHDKGSLFVEAGGRSTYLGSTFWGNTISSNFHTDAALAHVTPFPQLPVTSEAEKLQSQGRPSHSSVPRLEAKLFFQM